MFGIVSPATVDYQKPKIECTQPQHSAVVCVRALRLYAAVAGAGHDDGRDADAPARDESMDI